MTLVLRASNLPLSGSCVHCSLTGSQTTTAYLLSKLQSREISDQLYLSVLLPDLGLRGSHLQWTPPPHPQPHAAELLDEFEEPAHIDRYPPQPWEQRVCAISSYGAL